MGVPAQQLERVVPLRRKLLPPEPAAPAPVVPIAQARAADVNDLRASVTRLREQCEAQLEQLRSAFQRASELRDSRRDTRLRPSAGGGQSPAGA